ncbi:MAG: hypothetical protein AB1Z67_01940 [Candidatus Limnocylindrales bacterium]
MRFRNLKGLTDLPIEAVQYRFRNEPVLTVLPVQGVISGRSSLLVALPNELAVVTTDTQRRDGWMSSYVPWEAVGLGVIRSESATHRLNVYVGSLTLLAELWGPTGERALQDFIIAAGAVPQSMATAT